MSVEDIYLLTKSLKDQIDNTQLRLQLQSFTQALQKTSLPTPAEQIQALLNAQTAIMNVIDQLQPTDLTPQQDSVYASIVGNLFGVAAAQEFGRILTEAFGAPNNAVHKVESYRAQVNELWSRLEWLVPALEKALPMAIPATQHQLMFYVPVNFTVDSLNALLDEWKAIFRTMARAGGEGLDEPIAISSVERGSGWLAVASQVASLVSNIIRFVELAAKFVKERRQRRMALVGLITDASVLKIVEKSIEIELAARREELLEEFRAALPVGQGENEGEIRNLLAEKALKVEQFLESGGRVTVPRLGGSKAQERERRQLAEINKELAALDKATPIALLPGPTMKLLASPTDTTADAVGDDSTGRDTDKKD